MFQTLIKVIPLDLAAIISPVLFGLVIFLLGNKNHPKASTFTILLGALIVGIGITLAGFALGNTTEKSANPSIWTAIIDIILGIIFIIYGIRALVKTHKKDHKIQQEGQKNNLLKLFFLGIILCVFNDSFFLIFAASKEVGSSGIGNLNKLVFFIINIFCFTLPITIPLFIFIIFPKIAKPILEKINLIVMKYSKFVIFALFIIFGIYFILKGIKA